MKIEKFGKKEGDNVIENSNIHPNLKETILDSAESWNGSYEFESDFMFGFIQSLIAKGYCDDVSEEDDFEVMCYKWCIKYFAKYLPDLKFNIETESGYVLYSPDESVKDLYNEIDNTFGINAEELNLTTDYKILNKITGKLYFDEK